jgi:hypothetical protein
MPLTSGCCDPKPYSASTNSRVDKYTVSSNSYPQASHDHTFRMRLSGKCSDHSGAIKTAPH